jgi:hypothetical protein
LVYPTYVATKTNRSDHRLYRHSLRLLLLELKVAARPEVPLSTRLERGRMLATVVSLSKTAASFAEQLKTNPACGFLLTTAVAVQEHQQSRCY